MPRHSSRRRISTSMAARPCIELPRFPFHPSNPMKFTQRVFFVFHLIVAVGMFVGCNKSSGKKRVAFVTNGVASFWTIAAEGVKAGGEKFGVDAQTLMPSEGITD